MECFENELITPEDTGGISLTFGNSVAMVKLVTMIGRREGIGHILAEGVQRAAETIGRGAENFAVHVKGQEVPMHEPRLKRGLGLGYAVSPTGADHCHNLHDTSYVTSDAWEKIAAMGVLTPIPVDDLDPRKVRLYIYHSHGMILNNCLGLCQFLPWSYDQKVAIVKAITDWNTNWWELLKTAERAVTMARVFNLHARFTAKDDWLPDSFFTPQTSGPISHLAIDPSTLLQARQTYYGMMGWDPETGIPHRNKLEELDLCWLVESQ